MLVCSLRKWFSLSMARKMDYDIGREKRFFRALYLACSFLFLLANATSHSVCADDVLLVSNVNKRVGGQHFCEMDGVTVWAFLGLFVCFLSDTRATTSSLVPSAPL